MVMDKQRAIAERLKISQQTVSALLTGSRYTETVEVAMGLALESGKPAINYIRPALRGVYLKAHPELGEGEVRPLQQQRHSDQCPDPQPPGFVE